jgi:hypothetical protein
MIEQAVNTRRNQSNWVFLAALLVSIFFWLAPVAGVAVLMTPEWDNINWGAIRFAFFSNTMALPLTLPVVAFVLWRWMQSREISPRLKGWTYAAAIWSLIMLGMRGWA